MAGPAGYGKAGYGKAGYGKVGYGKAGYGNAGRKVGSVTCQQSQLVKNWTGRQNSPP